MSVTIYRQLQGRSRRLIVDLLLSAPEKNTPSGVGFRLPVLIDTGAARSCIDTMAALAMGLEPCGSSVIYPANGHADQVTDYEIDIDFDGYFICRNVRVAEIDLSDCYAIIGMDVLSQCDLHITHPDGNTQLEFIFD